MVDDDTTVDKDGDRVSGDRIAGGEGGGSAGCLDEEFKYYSKYNIVRRIKQLKYALLKTQRNTQHTSWDVSAAAVSAMSGGISSPGSESVSVLIDSLL